MSRTVATKTVYLGISNGYQTPEIVTLTNVMYGLLEIIRGGDHNGNTRIDGNMGFNGNYVYWHIIGFGRISCSDLQRYLQRENIPGNAVELVINTRPTPKISVIFDTTKLTPVSRRPLGLSTTSRELINTRRSSQTEPDNGKHDSIKKALIEKENSLPGQKKIKTKAVALSDGLSNQIYGLCIGIAFSILLIAIWNMIL